MMSQVAAYSWECNGKPEIRSFSVILLIMINSSQIARLVINVMTQPTKKKCCFVTFVIEVIIHTALDCAVFLKEGGIVLPVLDVGRVEREIQVVTNNGFTR